MIYIQFKVNLKFNEDLILIFSAHEVDGNLRAVELELERVAENLIQILFRIINQNLILITHEVDGNLIAVEPKLERVAKEKGSDDHSHRQSYRHLPSLQID